MFHKLLTISIVLLHTNEASAIYLLEEKNFHKMKMERKNQVNTGVWRRGGERSNTKVYHGNFLFPGAPIEVENLSGVEGDFPENNINMNNDVDSSAANYFSRFKRGANKSDKRDATACRSDESNCVETTEDTTRSTKVTPEFISKLKPATVFNEYPYEIAVLLNDDLNEIVKKADNNDLNKNNDVELKVVPLADGRDYVDIYVTPTDRIVDINEIYAKLREAANHTINTPDTTMKPNDYEIEAIKNIIVTDKVNGSDENGKANRNNIIMGIFNKEHQTWPQKPPKIDKENSDANIVPKAKNTVVSKTINGDGLIKVLSMLTKTFKKIMKQHEDIRKIHGQFYGASNDITRNIDEINRKFQEFEKKYNLMVQLSKKIATIETKMDAKVGQIEIDQKTLTKNLNDFVEHQKKFVLQQKQFYDIQKAILAQNEDISQKQTLIARSQNSVSHKQNEFARMIQKVKKLYNSRKNGKLSPNTKVQSQQKANYNITTTMKPTVKPNTAKTTESVKINLFSIPVKEKLKNQDENILSERDEQSIDDIVYKFYFNNTFLDNLLKTGVLANFVNEPNAAGHKKVEKRSREEIEKLMEKTVLLPVADNTATPNKRERRWISRTDRKNKRTQAKPPVANRFKYLDDSDTQHKKRKSHKLAHSKQNIVNATDKKVDAGDQAVMENIEKKSYAGEENNPYRLMATNFCNQIKQNTSSQILNWCIEKALRKLKAIDLKMALQPSGGLKEDRHPMAGDNVERLANTIHTFRKFKTSEPSLVLTPTELIPTVQSSAPGPLVIVESTSPPSPQSQDAMPGMFFPDNDKLESNLKQYELVPDNEGTVYFDGSVHSSKMVPGTDDEAASDVMPGMDSNSHVEIDPHALEIQARRRAYVRSYNANLLKNAKNQ